MAQKRIFSEEESAFIVANIDGRRNAEMIKLIKEKFGKEISVKQFQNWRTNHGVKSKIELPGWKKGLKAGVDFKFKKQQKNFLPIGTERISVRGIAEVKTGPLTRPSSNPKTSCSIRVPRQNVHQRRRRGA